MTRRSSQMYDRDQSERVTAGYDAVCSIQQELRGRKIVEATRLEGGYNTSNFKVSLNDGEVGVVRLRTSREQLTIEADILERISALAPDIPVPEVKMRIAKPLPGGYYAILTTFMDGTPMNTVEVSADADTRASLYEAVGDIAARIHGLSLPANGLFSRNFMLSPRYDNLATWTGIYLGECFRNSVFRRRLGEQRLFELESVLFRYSEYFRPGQDRQMCHGDFNQKNILVSRNSTGRWQVSALLDWEFCSAGSGLLDIGNLFRFETDVHSDTARAFSNAYRDAGGQLEWDWLDRAHFYDLLSLCGFLCDSRDRPTTISTALGQVDARLVRYAA